MSLPAMITAKCPECGDEGPKLVVEPGHISCLKCKTSWVWTEPKTPDPPANFWALVEIMGRQQIVGKVSEQTLAGTVFLRVDVPATKDEPAFTRFYGGSSIYCISPVAEGVARKMLEQSRFRNKPVDVYDLPQIEDAVRGREEDLV